MKTKRTWVYCRVAHDGPDSATMLAVQQCKLGFYAKKHDFEIVGSPSDTGNGLTFDRPGLMNFWAEAENGDVDILLIANRSRMGRDTGEATQYWQMLHKLGVNVHTADCGEVDLLCCKMPHARHPAFLQFFR